MSLVDTHSSRIAGPTFASEALAGALRLIGRAAGVLLLCVLNLFEPVVRTLLSVAAILGIVASVLFEVSAVGSRFPFLVIVAASLGCGVALILYCGVIAWLSR